MRGFGVSGFRFGIGGFGLEGFSACSTSFSGFGSFGFGFLGFLAESLGFWGLGLRTLGLTVKGLSFRVKGVGLSCTIASIVPCASPNFQIGNVVKVIATSVEIKIAKLCSKRCSC